MTNTTGDDEIDVSEYALDLADESVDDNRKTRSSRSISEDVLDEPDRGDAGRQTVDPTPEDEVQMDARADEDDNRVDDVPDERDQTQGGEL